MKAGKKSSFTSGIALCKTTASIVAKSVKRAIAPEAGALAELRGKWGLIIGRGKFFGVAKMPLGKRNYKKEYENYHSQPEQVKRRSERNSARRIMAKKHGKAAIKGKDIDHKDHNTSNNSTSNLRISSKSLNRSRNKKGLGK